jgi:Peptidase M66
VLAGNTTNLELTGQRDALVLVTPAASDAKAVVVQASVGGTVLGSRSLNPPAQLPLTEDNGARYSLTAHSAVLPAAWLRPGLQLQFSASNYSASSARSVTVGADPIFPMRILPFYLFGATGANSVPLAQSAAPHALAQQEMRAKWPISSLQANNHPAQTVSWPAIVIPPLNGQAAYLAANFDQQKDGFDVMSSVLRVLDGLREANGESMLASQYYSPLMMLDAKGVYRHPGGGLGGGSVGTGDAAYTGIFIHEAGHAFGMPHQGGAYSSGKYPYPGGSLKGSSWGFDPTNQEFLAPWIPTSASSFSKCKTDGNHQLDSSGRCVKQDPMQSGAGDQSSKYQYATFSDFSTAQMQSYLHNALYEDASFASSYKQWNAGSRAWVNASNATTNKGLYGTDNGLPLQRQVPVHAIVLDYSYTGTAGASMIYSPLSFTGNLLRNFDPTNAADRALITPNTGTYPWLCRNSGCDYTLRVTYADNSTYHSLIRQGFRPWYSETTAPNADANNPAHGDSQRTWVLNVPGGKALKKIELLSTPQVWTGMPANPAVLMSKNL